MSQFVEEEQITSALIKACLARNKNFRSLAPDVLTELTETECIQTFHQMLVEGNSDLADKFYRAMHKALGVERTVEVIKES